MRLLVLLIPVTLAYLTGTATVQAAGPRTAVAVVLEVDGDVYLAGTEKLRPIASGQRLQAGQQLVVSEDATAVVLYADGRYSRLSGPARVQVRKPSSVRPTGALGRQLANAFRNQSARRDATTVGGVRDPARVRLVSPLPVGLTSSTVTVMADPSTPPTRDLTLLLADQVTLTIAVAGRTIRQTVVSSDQFWKRSWSSDLAEVAPDNREPLMLTLTCEAVDEFGEPLPLAAPQVCTFTMARPQQLADLQRQLDELQAAAAAEQLPTDLQALLAVDCYWRNQFYGEALIRIARRQSERPDDRFWTDQLESRRHELQRLRADAVRPLVEH